MPTRRQSPGSLSALLVLAVAVVASACGSSGSSGFAAPGGGSSSSGGTGSSGSGGDGGYGNLGGDAGIFGEGGSGSSSGGQAPKGCDSSCPAAGGMCVNNSCIITENPGGISTGTQSQLQGGGTADAAFAWLYPYDKTVFPRGLIPPTMQFAGITADAEYVHITCASLDYQGFFKPAAGPPRLALVAGRVDRHHQRRVRPEESGSVVQITKISNGMVTGPITETWPVAQGSLRGVVYYETYDSQLAGGIGSVGIMKIQPGASKPDRDEDGLRKRLSHRQRRRLHARGGAVAALERQLQPGQQRRDHQGRRWQHVHLRRDLPGRQLRDVGDELPDVDRRAVAPLRHADGAPASPSPGGRASRTVARPRSRPTASTCVRPRGQGRGPHARR